MFYGQCSELCGKDHAFMPIAVRVVSDQEFAAWVEAAKKKFATNSGQHAGLGGRGRAVSRTAARGLSDKGDGTARSAQGLQSRITKMATTAATHDDHAT